MLKPKSSLAVEVDIASIIKWFPSFKLSLLLKNYLQDTQTLQLNEIGNYLQK
jgi:hypothetical protein